jgi:hypothetical protein
MFLPFRAIQISDVPFLFLLFTTCSCCVWCVFCIIASCAAMSPPPPPSFIMADMSNPEAGTEGGGGAGPSPPSPPDETKVLTQFQSHKDLHSQLFKKNHVSLVMNFRFKGRPHLYVYDSASDLTHDFNAGQIGIQIILPTPI